MAGRLANLERGQRADRVDGSIDLSTASKLVNVSEPSAKRARKVQERGAAELIEAVDQGAVSVGDAASVVDKPVAEQRAMLNLVQAGKAKNLQSASRQRSLERQRADIAAGQVALPQGVFEVIVVDPPWPYETRYDPGHWATRVAKPYPPMPLEEIAALRPPVADDGTVWLWTTNPFLPHAFKILEAWGVEYRTTLTWVKPRLGIGYYLRNCTEHCLMGTIGKPPLNLTNQRTDLAAPAREHSRKPDEFYRLVESLCVGRKLDYFSREPRPGWAQFGVEADRFEGVA